MSTWVRLCSLLFARQLLGNPHLAIRFIVCKHCLYGVCTVSLGLVFIGIIILLVCSFHLCLITHHYVIISWHVSFGILLLGLVSRLNYFTWVLGFLKELSIPSCVGSLWHLHISNVFRLYVLVLVLSLCVLCLPGPRWHLWPFLQPPWNSGHPVPPSSAEQRLQALLCSLATGDPLGSASAPGHCINLHLINASCEVCKPLQSSACWLRASNLSISLTTDARLECYYSLQLKLFLCFICFTKRYATPLFPCLISTVFIWILKWKLSTCILCRSRFVTIYLHVQQI